MIVYGILANGYLYTPSGAEDDPPRLYATKDEAEAVMKAAKGVPKRTDLWVQEFALELPSTDQSGAALNVIEGQGERYQGSDVSERGLIESMGQCGLVFAPGDQAETIRQMDQADEATA